MTEQQQMYHKVFKKTKLQAVRFHTEQPEVS